MTDFPARRRCPSDEDRSRRRIRHPVTIVRSTHGRTVEDSRADHPQLAQQTELGRAGGSSCPSERETGDT